MSRKKFDWLHSLQMQTRQVVVNHAAWQAQHEAVDKR